MDNYQITRLTKIVGDSLNSIKKEYTAYPKMYLSGKDAAYCPRKNYLKSKLKTKESLTALPLVTAEFGKIYETLLLNQLQVSGDLAGYDLTINDDLFYIPNLSYFGVIDAVISTDNEFLLIDVKTKHDLKDNTPSEQDIAQISFYSAITGLPCALVYLSRKVTEEFNKITYEVIPIEVNANHILHMAFFSTYCIKWNILPNIPKTFKKSIHCKYCSFYDYCWKDTPLEFKYNELTMQAYTDTKILADAYVENIDNMRTKFISLMQQDKLQGKYFRKLEERIPT